MLNKIKRYWNLIDNMGFRYLFFQVHHRLSIKTGVFRKKFPTNPPLKEFITLSDWRKLSIPFFFESKEELNSRGFSADFITEEKVVNEIKKGNFLFFSSKIFKLGTAYDWLTNPETNFRYDITTHWSAIADLSKEAGDIKYVWEKARFSWLHTIIRYDLKLGNDESSFVFSEIESFIDGNPINQGPNYKCSQEISLRLLNWTFALNYYKHSENLTEELFKKIMNAIYWQLDHVKENINFSRIAVRNNHAITETLTLFLSHLLFPFIPATKPWSVQGKTWFEEEVKYQIYEDGSFLQFSHNYHRVVVQLLTWAIKLSELNQVQLPDVVYSRAKKTVEFLYNHQDERTGFLPNYGMNDGALFFPLNNKEYRDYRPQLQALAAVLNMKLYDETFEDQQWFLGDVKNSKLDKLKKERVLNFEKGGFYGFREEDCLTTIRCGTYKDRPAQADALNLDVWYQGENVIFDPGTYKYNTEEQYLDFYHGTKGHNTVTIGGKSQMIKGGRFIWYYWTKAFGQSVVEDTETFKFSGNIAGFKGLGSRSTHKREVLKYKGVAKWVVIDEIDYTGELPMVQHWNLLANSSFKLLIEAKDGSGNSLKREYQDAWDSPKYGTKKGFQQIVFSSKSKKIETTIEIVLL